jgi:NAD+ synthase
MIKLDRELLKIDCKQVEDDIISFIVRIVSEAKADGVVLGLSGGIDSSVVATLCVKALGKQRVLGLFMPATFTPTEDQDDAKALADKLGIRTHSIPLSRIVDSFLETVPLKERNRVAVGNVFARMRMVVNYFVANSLNYLVSGTGDRSELLIGYFTKYGDGGADLLPIGHLYKTQVRELARHLGLPSEMVDKPASPQLWKGQKAADEIPIDYPILDLILYGLFDAKVGENDIAKQLNIQSEIVETVQQSHERSRHKRTTPPMPPAPNPGENSPGI